MTRKEDWIGPDSDPKRYQRQIDATKYSTEAIRGLRTDLADSISETPQHKYHAKKSESLALIYPELRGMTFPSGIEGARAQQLIVLQRAGEIKGLRFHPSIVLTLAEIKYKPDSVYFDTAISEQVYEEVKGIVTDRWRMIKKLWKYYGPARLRIVKNGPNGPYVTEEIIPT